VSRLRLRLLGRFEAECEDGGPLPPLGGKGQALLAYLALPAGRHQLREQLASLLWGDLSVARARRNLRQVLFSLRRTLPAAETLRLDGDAVALDATLVEVDVARFEAAVSEGTSEALERAATLYGGDLLAGLVVQAPPFEEWLAAERERLRERAVEALARLCAHQRAAGTLEAAVDTALRLLALDSLQEPIHRTLMRLYSDLGRRGAAFRQYQACVAALERELGVEPDEETQLLYQDILRRVRPADAAPLATGAPVAEWSESPIPALPVEGPLIGRERERAVLQAALETAWAGAGRVVTVLGEAGIGKSRLVGALAADASGHGGGVLVGRAYESERGLPFGLWIDAFRTGRVVEDPELLAGLGTRERAELGRLVPLPASAAPGPFDPGQLFKAVALLVVRAASRQPLLILLEDVHWADEMSLRLLAYLGRQLATHRVLVVITGREEELDLSGALDRTFEELARARRLEALALAPLSRAATSTLVEQLLPRGTLRDQVATFEEDVWRLSEGNPFVVVETVQAYRQGSPPGAPRMVMPARVQEVIVQRVERLGEGSRRLAAAAAVVGRECHFALLQRTAGLDDEGAVEAVEELVRRRVLRAANDRFRLAHDRIREAVYQHLLPPRRALLHRRAADALETLRGAGTVPDPSTLGMHYHRAGEWDRAASYHHEAARLAAERFAYREAVLAAEAALEAVGRLPTDVTTRAHAFELEMLLAFSLVFLGEYEAALAHYDVAARCAEILADEDRRARALAARVTPLAFLGRYAEARETGERALTLAAGRDDLTGQAWAHLGLARVCLDTGDYPACERHARALAGCQQKLPGGPAALIPLLPPLLGDQYWLAVSYAMRGEFADGLAVARAMLEAAERLDRPLARIWAAYALARVHLSKGDAEDARLILEPLLAQSRDVEFWAFYTRIAWALGAAYAQGGRVAEGVVLLEEAVAHARSTRFHSGLAVLLSMLAKGYLLAGRLEDAEGTAEEAFELARQMHERGNETVALRVLAEIAAQRDPPDLAGAENAYGQALALAAVLGRRPTEAHCHLGLGTLYRAIGQPARARAALLLAAESFRALGMTSWLARAEAELQALDAVP
jgi:DNA-binding SARP family transcriptional activator